MKISVDEAKTLYPAAPDWPKEKLDEEFGAETFQPKDYEEIKTFEDACYKLGYDPGSITTENDTPDEAAYKKLKVVVKAINNGWLPDWSNGSQYKYYPWFRVLSSGFGFSHSGYDYGHTTSTVGSRLCTDSIEKALYIATQFEELYKDYFLYSE
jgi:hypothetical protein